MMKPHNILITVLLTITLAACSTPAVTTTSSNPVAEVTTTSSPVETSAPVVVTFTDPVLETMIRGAMGKTEGEITFAEAQGVTRMDLTDSLQQQLSKFTPITNLDGLEAFTNLESLDLSQNAVTDISPLAGLTKLTALSLAGNPVTDVAPLAKLTNLKLLILSNCQAQDYSALSNLINLQVLWLDNSTISDVSPLASLTNLQALYLDKSSVEDYSSLENIYTTLANKDFIISYTLKDLGFNLDPNNHEAYFDIELASFTVTHDQWGPPSREDNQNIIRMTLYLNDEYKTSIGYYDVHKVYLCQMDKDGQPPVNYLYYIETGEFSIEGEDRVNAEYAKFDRIEEDVSLPKLRVVGLVIDKVDKIMHGMELGTAGMLNQVRQWTDQGDLAKLILLLSKNQYQVYVSSDHGNIEATGFGRPDEGATADLRGERARIYPNGSLRAIVKEKFPESVEWKPVGLPANYYPLLAANRTAFVQKDKHTVCHGGITLEEVIVPLIKVEKL